MFAINMAHNIIQVNIKNTLKIGWKCYSPEPGVLKVLKLVMFGDVGYVPELVFLCCYLSLKNHAPDKS